MNIEVTVKDQTRVRSGAERINIGNDQIWTGFCLTHTRGEERIIHTSILLASVGYTHIYIAVKEYVFNMQIGKGS